MRERLLVTTDAKGVPAARVACHRLWELVEFLSGQRAAVSYAYETTCFVVSFPRLDPAAAQRTLDEWVDAETAAVT